MEGSQEEAWPGNWNGAVHRVTGWSGNRSGAERRGVRRAARKDALGHGRELQADGLGGKQRQSESGTLQEAGGEDDGCSVPQEACSGEDEKTPLKAGSCEGEEAPQVAGIGKTKARDPFLEAGSVEDEGEGTLLEVAQLTNR